VCTFCPLVALSGSIRSFWYASIGFLGFTCQSLQGGGGFVLTAFNGFLLLYSRGQPDSGLLAGTGPILYGIASYLLFV